jgi:hypothetical protein
MRLFTLSLPLSVLQIVAAHSVFTTLFVNDIGQGDGTCVRMNMTPDNCTLPVINLASNDMACGMYFRNSSLLDHYQYCDLSQSTF